MRYTEPLTNGPDAGKVTKGRWASERGYNEVSDTEVPSKRLGTPKSCFKVFQGRLGTHRCAELVLIGPVRTFWLLTGSQLPVRFDLLVIEWIFWNLPPFLHSGLTWRCNVTSFEPEQSGLGWC